MTLVVRPVRLKLLARSGQVLPGARVKATLDDYQVDGVDVVPLVWEFAEDPAAPGYYVASLWPNTRGAGGTQYLISADSGEERMQAQMHTVTAGSGTAAIVMTVNEQPWPPVYEADTAVSAARVFSDAAGQSAGLALSARQTVEQVSAEFGEVGAILPEVREKAAAAIHAADLGAASSTAAQFAAAQVLSRGSAFLANACAGAKFAPVYVVGDSISEGAASTLWWRDGWASIVRRGMQQRFGNANFGFANFNLVTYDTYPTDPDLLPTTEKYPHTVTHPSFVAVGYAFKDFMFGGTGARLPNLGDYLDVEFVGKDAVLVYQRDQAGGALLDVLLDGQLVGHIDTKANLDLVGTSLPNASFSIPVTAAQYGPHTVRFINSDGGNALLSGMCYFEDVANWGSPVLFNCGRSSIALCDIPDDLLVMYASSGAASIFALGVNDDILSATSPADYTAEKFRAKLELYLTAAAQAGKPVLMLDFIFSKPASNPFKTALRDKAAEHNVVFIDFGALWSRDVAANEALRFLHWDKVHPTDQGHRFIATTVLQWLALDYPSETPFSVRCAPRLTNGWVWFGPPAKYAYPAFSVRDGWLCMEGVIRSGSTEPYSEIFTLPKNFRPPADLIFLVNAAHGVGEIEVLQTGVVRVGSSINNSFVSLSGVSFKLARA